MALNKRQKLYLFREWWLKLDEQDKFQMIFKSKPELKAEVQPILEARRTQLEADKTTLNQQFLDDEIAKLDEQIQDADDVITNI